MTVEDEVPGRQLRDLQLVELEILREFVRVCEAHGLRYYLAYGTLLGAVLHRGFIPWDDDIDVTMPRPDYERFARICASELRPGFTWQSYRTDRHYPFLFGKLLKDGTVLRGMTLVTWTRTRLSPRRLSRARSRAPAIRMMTRCAHVAHGPTAPPSSGKTSM